jgi:hypothetical protein
MAAVYLLSCLIKEKLREVGWIYRFDRRSLSGPTRPRSIFR